jgi:hypothetical protein
LQAMWETWQLWMLPGLWMVQSHAVLPKLG